MNYCYVIYETDWDYYNHSGQRHDLECVYLSEDDAQAEVDKRNDLHNSVLEQNFFKDILNWERSWAERQALIDAGLRTYPWSVERPEFESERIWFIDEIELR